MSLITTCGTTTCSLRPRTPSHAQVRSARPNGRHGRPSVRRWRRRSPSRLPRRWAEPERTGGGWDLNGDLMVSCGFRWFHRFDGTRYPKFGGFLLFWIPISSRRVCAIYIHLHPSTTVKVPVLFHLCRFQRSFPFFNDVFIVFGSWLSQTYFSAS